LRWTCLSPGVCRSATSEGRARAPQHPRATGSLRDLAPPARRPGGGGGRRARQSADGTRSRLMKNPFSARPLNKVRMQGGARGVLGSYAAAPRERAGYPSGGWVPQMSLFQRPAGELRGGPDNGAKGAPRCGHSAHHQDCRDSLRTGGMGLGKHRGPALRYAGGTHAPHRLGMTGGAAEGVPQEKLTDRRNHSPSTR
jgi:hypothetical protein